jgi:hypothetical protein
MYYYGAPLGCGQARSPDTIDLIWIAAADLPERGHPVYVTSSANVLQRHMPYSFRPIQSESLPSFVMG